MPSILLVFKYSYSHPDPPSSLSTFLLNYSHTHTFCTYDCFWIGAWTTCGTYRDHLYHIFSFTSTLIHCSVFFSFLSGGITIWHNLLRLLENEVRDRHWRLTFETTMTHWTKKCLMFVLCLKLPIKQLMKNIIMLLFMHHTSPSLLRLVTLIVLFSFAVPKLMSKDVVECFRKAITRLET